MPVRTDEQLKKHQAALMELLTVFDNICRRLGISYQLFAGTALGAVRHKGFIPWDDDLDDKISCDTDSRSDESDD